MKMAVALCMPLMQQMPIAEGGLIASIAKPIPENCAASAGIWPSDVIGVILWVAGFAMECAADFQKYGYKQNPANNGRFVNVGKPSTTGTVAKAKIGEVMTA